MNHNNHKVKNRTLEKRDEKIKFLEIINYEEGF